MLLDYSGRQSATGCHHCYREQDHYHAAFLNHPTNPLSQALAEETLFIIIPCPVNVIHPRYYTRKGKRGLSPNRLTITHPRYTGYKGMASEIILDGEIIEQNLRQNHLDFSWLYRELQSRNISDVRDVFFATLQADGTLYVDLKKDSLDYVQRIED